MLTTAGVAPYTSVLDLKRGLKCKSCRWKGRALVSNGVACSKRVGRRPVGQGDAAQV